MTPCFRIKPSAYSIAFESEDTLHLPVFNFLFQFSSLVISRIKEQCRRTLLPSTGYEPRQILSSLTRLNLSLSFTLPPTLPSTRYEPRQIISSMTRLTLSCSNPTPLSHTPHTRPTYFTNSNILIFVLFSLDHIHLTIYCRPCFFSQFYTRLKTKTHI